MFHKPDPTDVKPCRHMQTLVSAWTDGRLSGLARWYTEAHMKSCPQCRSSVPFLHDLRSRLGALGQSPGGEATGGEALTETQRQALEAAWEQAERGK